MPLGAMSQSDIMISIPSGLFKDVCQIIENARQRVAINVNSELTLMYWHIGERINRDVLHDKRAEYGKAIVSTLSTQLLSFIVTYTSFRKDNNFP